MSRGRKRKSQKGTFSEENMRQAVRQVLIGDNGVKLSLRKAAQENGVSFQTLQRYVKKTRCNIDAIGESSMKSNYKHRLVFNENQENELASYVIKCSKMCYGRTTKDTRNLAYEMAHLNSIKIPANWHRTKMAGIDWLYGFLKRHPNLSIRQPEGCSLSRASSFNEHNVKIFFDNLEKVYGRSPKFSDGTRIYNLDETATTTVHRPKKVLSAKGTKQVSQCTSGERGVLITSCCIISASGNTLPPVMIFPRKKFKPHMIKGAPPGTLGLASPSGWMNGELFSLVMKHFVQYSGSTIENPSILILDNHESHLSVETLNIAKKNGVIMVTLPPHCSHRLQPLDISVFASFKAHYNSAVDSWLLHHPGIPLTIYDVAACVGLAFERSMTPSNIKSGFQKAGIYPFDKHIFSKDDFLSSAVTDRPIPLTAPSTSSPLSEGASCSNNLTSPDIDVPERMIGKINTTEKFVSPEIFRGFPKAGERKLSNSHRKKATSIVPTDTPEKDRIELKHQEKEEKQNRKRNLTKKEAAKKNVFSKKIKPLLKEISSDEEEDEDVPIESSDEETDWIPQPDPTAFEELQRNPTINDYVLVEFQSKQKVFYIGKVTSCDASSNEVEVSFLRKSLKFDRHFVFPVQPDIAHVALQDVKMILPPPCVLGQTKRLQSFFKFEINFSNFDLR